MEEILAYLESVESLYPYGIPIRLVDEASDKLASDKKVTFVGNALTSDGRNLLEAAITKGLKLDLSQIEITVGDNIQNIISAATSSHVVVFGDNSLSTDKKKENDFLLISEKNVLLTVHPDEVCKNATLKKDMWAQLQKLIGHI